MASTETLHDAFLDELRDAYDAEKQLLKALPKLAKAAESDELRTAFQTHLKETQGHADRLEQVFASLDERVRGKHCDGMAGIIEEGKAVLEEDFEGTTLDACLIASAQRAEHYEMAVYGTLVAWAKAMGHDQAAGLLEEDPRRGEGDRHQADADCREWHQPGGCGDGARRERPEGRSTANLAPVRGHAVTGAEIVELQIERERASHRRAPLTDLALPGIRRAAPRHGFFGPVSRGLVLARPRAAWHHPSIAAIF